MPTTLIDVPDNLLTVLAIPPPSDVDVERLLLHLVAARRSDGVRAAGGLPQPALPQRRGRYLRVPERPANAMDTRLRAGPVQFWFDRDLTQAYLVLNGEVQLWQRAKPCVSESFIGRAG